MKKLLLAVGAAVGYLVGTERGRAKLAVITGKAKQAWKDPKVQEKVHQATETMKEQAPLVAETIRRHEGPMTPVRLRVTTQAATPRRPRAGTRTAPPRG
jgi:hypothetical protein